MDGKLRSQYPFESADVNFRRETAKDEDSVVAALIYCFSIAGHRKTPPNDKGSFLMASAVDGMDGRHDEAAKASVDVSSIGKDATNLWNHYYGRPRINSRDYIEDESSDIDQDLVEGKDPGGTTGHFGEKYNGFASISSERNATPIVQSRKTNHGKPAHKNDARNPRVGQTAPRTHSFYYTPFYHPYPLPWSEVAGRPEGSGHGGAVSLLQPSKQPPPQLSQFNSFIPPDGHPTPQENPAPKGAGKELPKPRGAAIMGTAQPTVGNGRAKQMHFSAIDLEVQSFTPGPPSSSWRCTCKNTR